MAPTLSVLQLDTNFPRVAGDVGCAQSYRDEVEIIRIPAATVAHVVTNRPETIDIAPFERALRKAKGDIVATSCGFLSYWQSYLGAHTDKPFISSALIALDHLSQAYTPEELMILTFDANSFTAAHLGQHKSYARSVLGLPPACHLRDVISNNRAQLDTARAGRELCEHVAAHQTPKHRHILFECTNLPPYKAPLIAQTGLPVTDILSMIEATRPNTVHPDFLESRNHD